MEFFRRAAGRPQQLAIIAGAFNPVTVAHLALARAALSHFGARNAEVVFVLPKLFPHKQYHGASFAERLQMLQAAVLDQPEFSIAAAEGGLFAEIASECRAAYGPDTRLTFAVGRDAAERILNWDYGEPDAVDNMLRQFNLLVAARGGKLDTPSAIRHAVQPLTLTGAFDRVSSTEVRRRITEGLPWEHLAPDGARDLMRRIYR